MIVYKRIYFLLWILCILGALSVLPYLQYLGVAVSMRQALLSVLQSALFLGLICWLSSKIVPKTDLHPFVFTKPLQRIVYPGVIAGVFIGLVIFFSDKTLFGNSLISGIHPPFWAGALASIYGAVNEEVLCRLFLLTLIYFILNKIFRFGTGKRLYALWAATILVALIFGLGHLPAAFQLSSPSAFEIFRILFLNGVAGVVFGWLYWSRGLWTAMAAHFVADLVIHVFLI